MAAHVDAAVVGGHHAATEFAGEVGVGEVFRLHVGVLVLAEGFGGDDGGETGVLHDEGIFVGSGHIGEVSVPEAVGIVAIEGQHLSELFGAVQFGPSCAGVEGCVETCLHGHLLECLIVRPRPTAFVLYLHPHDGASVFPQ